MMSKPEEMWKELGKCTRVVMSLHARPDGDSLGSCTALKYVLERDFGMTVDLVSFDPIDENLATLSIDHGIEFGKDISEIDFSLYDAIIVADSSLSNLSSKRKDLSFPADVPVYVFDHHATTGPFGKFNYIDSNAPSACSVLVEFFRKVSVKFDHDLCLRLILGICTDTGFFSYNMAPLRALEEVAFLIKSGNVDFYSEITLPIRMSESLKSKKFFARIIENTVVESSIGLAYSTLSLSEVKELGLDASDIRGGIRAIQDLKNIDFTLTLIETEDQIKGSFRSSRNIDVSRFAVALGGGGHKAAAAFIIHSMSLKKAVKKVLDTIKEVGIHPIN